MENNGFINFLNNSVYVVSGSAIFGNLFQFIEDHAAGVMGCVALVTYLTGVLFQVLHYRLRARELAHDHKLDPLKYSQRKH